MCQTVQGILSNQTSHYFKCILKCKDFKFLVTFTKQTNNPIINQSTYPTNVKAFASAFTFNKQKNLNTVFSFTTSSN